MNLILVLFYCTFLQLIAQDSWELKKDEYGIKVFLKDAEIENLKSYKAEGLIKAPIDSVYGFLTDFSNFKDWVNFCKESVLLEYRPDQSYTYYAFYDMPWPLNSREAYSNVQIIYKSPDSIQVATQPAGWDSNPDKGIIRITQFREEFWLIKKESNKTLIKMQGFYDPQGQIPDWLVNLFLSNGPYGTILTLRNRLEN